MVGLSAAAILGLSVSRYTATLDAVPPMLQGVHRIVCVGDSITQQGESPAGYVWLIRHNLQLIFPNQSFDVLNAGISGNRSNDMLDRFERDVLSHNPDLVLISVGVNDVWHGFSEGHPQGDGPGGIPLADYRQNVAAMIDRTVAKHAKAVLLLATPIGEDLGNAENLKAVAYNNTLRDLAVTKSATVIDLQTPFRKLIDSYRTTTGNTQNFLTVDGVHMNAQGNQVMAQAVLTALGVADSDRRRVDSQVVDALKASHPHPGPLPLGVVVSENMPATASSNYSAQYSADQPDRSGKAFDQRWCAASGDFDPNPWWQVDLGQDQPLTGIHIQFAPDDADTWKYKVQVSDDGKSFRDLIDRTHALQYFSEENHRFEPQAKGRFVRIVFTSPTSAMNWASLRHVQVYGPTSR